MSHSSLKGDFILRPAVNRFCCKRVTPSTRTCLRRLFLFLVFLASLGGGPNETWGVSFSTFGFGPKAIGMGQAFTGVADDFTAAWYNPAGMTLHNRLEAGFGYSYMRPFLEVNGKDFRVQDCHSLSLGVSLPIPFAAWLKDRIYFGLAFYMPWNLIFGLKVPLPQEPQFVLLQNEPRDITIVPAVAVRLHPALSVGGSVILNDNTFGSFNATLTSENEVVLDVNQELIVTLTPAVAVLLSPGRIWPILQGLRAGFTWRDAFMIKYTFKPLIGIGTIPLIIDFAAISMYQPEQFTLGLSYKVTQRLTAAVDLSYQLWSRMPDPNLVTGFDFKFPIFPVTFTPTQPLAPHMRDILVPRFGVHYEAVSSDRADISLRAGYSFEASPVPEQEGFTNYMDNDKHVFAFSPEVRIKRWAGKALKYPLSVGGFIQYHHITRRAARKDPQVLEAYPGYPFTSIEGRGAILNVGLFVSSSLEMP